MAAENAFKILNLPERFALDEETIEEHWRQAIALVHPDRFAGKSAAERRVAQQWAERINSARDALIDPVSRAKILLEAADVDVGEESDTHMPEDFLVEQIELCERVELAYGDLYALESIWDEVEAQKETLLARLEKAIDQTHDLTDARDAVRRLMFAEKMLGNIDKLMNPRR